jgi:hypothetical protein
VRAVRRLSERLRWGSCAILRMVSGIARLRRLEWGRRPFLVTLGKGRRPFISSAVVLVLPAVVVIALQRPAVVLLVLTAAAVVVFALVAVLARDRMVVAHR